MIPMPFDYNHLNIAKPKNGNTDIYRFVKNRILETHNFYNCNLRTDSINKFKKSVITQAFFFGRNPLSATHKYEEKINDFFSYIDEHSGWGAIQ